MSENNLTDYDKIERPRAFETIVYGGLTVGVLDGLAATTSAAVSGVSPTIVFQYISAALLGRASYGYGWATVLLGILLHFTVAFSAALVYYFLSCKFPFLIRQAVVSGIIYGIAVHLLMSFIIVPLSSAPPIPFSIAGLIRSLVIHILFVGLPIALVARWSAKKHQ